MHGRRMGGDVPAADVGEAVSDAQVLFQVECELKDALVLLNVACGWAQLLDVYAADYAATQIAPGAVACLRRAARAARRAPIRTHTPAPAPTADARPARTAPNRRTR